MKLELFLLFALGVPSTSACSYYTRCHCYDSDGTPNNAATKTVCDLYKVLPYKPRLQYDTYEYGPNTIYQECAFSGSIFKNCIFKEQCQWAGATGGDSSCYCKDDQDPACQ